MARLRKVDAEAIMNVIDSPELVRVLTDSLRRILEREDEWDVLVQRAGVQGRWTPDRVSELLDQQPDGLFWLAVELNEKRLL
jgi:hypothetical protein